MKLILTEPAEPITNGVPLVIVEPKNLTVVCPDWGLGHPEKVLRAGDPDLPVSHGMCPECALFLDAQDRLDAVTLEQYRAYLSSPLDPRD